MSAPTGKASLSERFFETLIRAYPEEFVHCYRPELMEFFRADMDRARAASPLGLVSFWARTVTDLTASAVRQHRALRRERRQATERPPSHRGREFVHSVMQDLRIALRGLAATPGFAAVAILTLAIGIGANTTIFSAVEVFMLRPLPYPNSHELMALYTANAERGWAQVDYSVADFHAVREQLTTADVGGYFWDNVNVADDRAQPVRLDAMRISHNFFDVLGVAPVLGRSPSLDEEQIGTTPAVMISHALWNSRYGADPGALDQLVELDGVMHRIVGVAPEGFWFRSLGIDMWPVFQFTEGQESRDAGRWVGPLVRRRADVSQETFVAELEAVGARLAADFPDYNGGSRFYAITLHADTFDEEFKVGSTIAMLAVLFVLLIACANVANLLLARSMRRSREVAVRTALGASRGRIIRQLLTEASVVAVLGGVVGVLLSVVGIRALVSIIPPETPGAPDIGLSGISLAFTGLVTALTAVLFGLAPALQGSAIQLTESLKDGGRTGSGTRGGRLRKGLVIAEMALAMVLLVSSGLLVKGYLNLRAVDRGFDTGDVLSLRVSVHGTRYTDDEAISRFYVRAMEEIGSVPGVMHVSAINRLPLSGWSSVSYSIAGEPVDDETRLPFVVRHMVMPDFFGTVEVPVLVGRGITVRDMATSQQVAVVNQAFAGRHFGSAEDAIGGVIELDRGDRTIVGVVPDLAWTGPVPRPTMFLPATQATVRTMSLLVRTGAGGDPTALAVPVRRAIERVDPALPVFRVATLQDVMLQQTQGDAIMGRVMAVLGIVALILSVIGVYGVMAYNVQQRVQEVGIRMALGAEARDVVRLMMRQGMVLAGVGMLLGLGMALAATRGLSTFLFGVSPFDVGTFAGVTGLLLGAALLATWVPALRSAKVDPNVALRSE